jgi:hypothetical protein
MYTAATNLNENKIFIYSFQLIFGKVVSSTYREMFGSNMEIQFQYFWKC